MTSAFCEGRYLHRIIKPTENSAQDTKQWNRERLKHFNLPLPYSMVSEKNKPMGEENKLSTGFAEITWLGNLAW